MEIDNDVLEILNESVADDSEIRVRPNFENKYELVTRMAFLTGVRDKFFEDGNTIFVRSIYEKLKKDERAMIVRSLCLLRNSIEHNFKRFNEAMYKEGRSFFALTEYYPEEAFLYVERKGIVLSNGRQISEILCEINGHISNRINNCKDLIPSWVNWDYIKELFIMPNGNTREGTHKAANLFYENINCYPYGVYINWKPQEIGNIFFNDYKFVTSLYTWHKDKFHDVSNLSDVSQDTKERIYSFINQSDATIFIVDCENSDPYSLCAMFNSLDERQLAKVKQLILYDDPKAPTGWKFFEQHIKIDLEKIDHIIIERILDNKSLLDVKLTARVTKEFYANKIRSFVLVSSDSDFWGLIQELPEADFIVMLEHRKTSDELKAVLDENDIFYCFTDDFYTGGDDSLKKEALFAEFTGKFEGFKFNIHELFDEVLMKTRVELQDGEKKRFYEQYLKNIQLVMDKEGNYSIELKRK